MRKTKPAPPPPPPPLPSAASSSSSPTVLATSNYEGSSINRCNAWEDQKTNKDETNRNRQSFTHMSCEENFHYMSYLDKSMEGKWKRKKGPAPPCPIPHKRKVNLYLFYINFFYKNFEIIITNVELYNLRFSFHFFSSFFFSKYVTTSFKLNFYK